MLRIRKWEQEISRFNQFKNPVKIRIYVEYQVKFETEHE